MAKTRQTEKDRGKTQSQRALAYKLTAPGIDQRAISRSELLERVLDQNSARVVVLQAPAGHGKTTLLQQLRMSCEQKGDLTGWLSIDESDNDIHRFAEHLAAMLGAIEQASDAPRKSRAPEQQQTEYGSDWLVSTLLDIEKDCAIFLDDLHAVTARQSIAMLRNTLAQIPDHVQVFIASRTMPDLSLSRLTVSGEALLVRAEDLSFSAEETHHYFNSASSLELAPEEVKAIQAQTAGWPAALQLFRLALVDPAVRSRLHTLSDDRTLDLTSYLAENVLQQQPESLRQFLVASSAFSRMSGPLCDSVLAIDNSEEHLIELEANSLFVRRVEGERRWFTYHPLFRSFLIDQLSLTDPKKVLRLRQAAAEWFHQNDYFEEALEHYLESADPSAAANVLDEWSQQLVPAAHMMTVERWSERLPLAEIEKRPNLIIKVAWALTFLRRHTRLAPLVPLLKAKASTLSPSDLDPRVVLSMIAILDDELAEAELIVENLNVSQKPPTPFDAFQWGAACNARGYAATADSQFARAHEHFAQARLLSDPTAASFTWAYSASLAGVAYIAQGQLQEAVALHKSCMRDPRMFVDESITQASLVASHIIALYESNALAEAESIFYRFRSVIASAVLHDHLAVAYISVARIHDGKGQHSKALEILDEAESIAYASHWSRVACVIQWERVRRELILDQFDRAKAIAERADKMPSGTHEKVDWFRNSEDVHGSNMVKLRLMVGFEDPNKALRTLTPALTRAKIKGRIHQQIKLLQMKAIAQWRKQSSARAHGYLREAIDLATPGGYVRTFLEEGELFAEILASYLSPFCARDGQNSAEDGHSFVEKLAMNAGLGKLASSEMDSRPSISPRVTNDFTPREMQILSMLASFASSEDLQKALGVSINGLKFHLKNIYSKLGVSSRMEAARVARKMGF